MYLFFLFIQYAFYVFKKKFSPTFFKTLWLFTFNVYIVLQKKKNDETYIQKIRCKKKKETKNNNYILEIYFVSILYRDYLKKMKFLGRKEKNGLL